MYKTVTLEQMKRMSIDDIVNLYKDGYGLEPSCKSCGNGETNYYSNRLGPASCPESIIKGTTKTLTVSVITPGTKPYTLKFYVDGSLKTISATWDDTNNRFIFVWTFNETVGNHTYATEIVDSCATSVKTSNRDICTINIVAPCGIPEVVLTIPA